MGLGLLMGIKLTLDMKAVYPYKRIYKTKEEFLKAKRDPRFDASLYVENSSTGEYVRVERKDRPEPFFPITNVQTRTLVYILLQILDVTNFVTDFDKVPDTIIHWIPKVIDLINIFIIDPPNTAFAASVNHKDLNIPCFYN